MLSFIKICILPCFNNLINIIIKFTLYIAVFTIYIIVTALMIIDKCFQKLSISNRHIPGEVRLGDSKKYQKILIWSPIRSLI